MAWTRDDASVVASSLHSGSGDHHGGSRRGVASAVALGCECGCARFESVVVALSAPEADEG